MADDIVWGTGYGSKRHIPDDEGIKSTRGGRYARAACSSLVYLSAFTSDAAEETSPFVMRKTPCKRCATKAGVNACPTCHGSGTVSA